MQFQQCGRVLRAAASSTRKSFLDWPAMETRSPPSERAISRDSYQPRFVSSSRYQCPFPPSSTRHCTASWAAAVDATTPASAAATTLSIHGMVRYSFSWGRNGLRSNRNVAGALQETVCNWRRMAEYVGSGRKPCRRNKFTWRFARRKVGLGFKWDRWADDSIKGQGRSEGPFER